MMKQPHGDSDGATDSYSVPNAVSDGGDAWRWLLTGGLLLPLLYVVTPYGPLASALYVATTALAAVAVALAVKRRLQLFRPAAWRLIAAALGLAASGHAV